MAVTTQKSTEYTNATATPVTLNEANVYHGRVELLTLLMTKMELETQHHLLLFAHCLQEK